MTALQTSPLVARRLEPADHGVWDALAGGSPGTGFGQSSGWAAFRRREGFRVEPVGVYAGARLVGGAMLHVYPAASSGTILLAPDGPVLPWEDEELCRAALRCIIDVARRIAVEEQAIALRIEPHLSPPRPPALREFVRAPVDVYPEHTLLVDLRPGETERLSRMRPKGRYNLRLSWRHGVEVETSTRVADLRRFYVLFEAAAVRDGFFAEPYGFFLNLAQALLAAGSLRLYLASHDGEDLAAATVVRFGRRATYLYGGSSGAKRNLMASYALHWAAMADSRADGFTEYDFYGYEPFGLADHPYAGFSRFKRQFGGAVWRFLGAHDYVFYDQLSSTFAGALRLLADARAREGSVSHAG